MSIITLTNAAIARRPDTVPLNTTPKGISEIAKASFTVPTDATKGTASNQSSSIDTALNVISGYIPTEVLTLYVAVAAAIQPSTSTTEPHPVTSAQWLAFWLFLVATPTVVWVVYAGKVKAMQKPLPMQLGAWPLWEMIAASIAYFAWALALPSTPFKQYEGHGYSQAVAAVVVLVASVGLGLLAPLFQRPLSTN